MLLHLRKELQVLGSQLDLKGTLILSPEGVNIAVSGLRHSVESFKTHLARLIEELRNLQYQETESVMHPFQHFFVKLKKQIIPSVTTYHPAQMKSAPYITPHKLMDWLVHQKDIILLDVRNDYEVEKGSFQNKISFNMEHFKDFPRYLDEKQIARFRQKPVVTFCTGGVRCEKASAILLEKGLNEVYQLQGGILNYFKHCKNAYYEGSCFVFDEREVIQPL